MIPPPLPANESVRLKRLRALGILDTAPEDRFDVITRLAKQVFNVDIAVVSLVDADRQWFKSKQGLDACETSRDVSFCGYTILESKVMIVPDASKDPRFHDNPLVTGPPNIRFYAGYPVEANGATIGTLCIIHSEPRELSEPQIAMLSDLGRLVEKEMESMELAALDEATGLVNRRGLQTTGRHLVEISKRTGEAVSVLFFDLDGFKQINDTFGHEEGDRALSEFSSCLQEAFRESDVVARLGGDEFCVLVATGPTHALQRPLLLLAENVGERNATRDARCAIRYSVGMATFDPSQHDSFEDLLRDADEAMYSDKNHGRGEAA